MTRVLLLMCGLALCVVAQQGVSHTTFTWNGWSDVHALSNGLVDVRIVPQVGGRIMAFSMNRNDPYWIDSELLGVIYPNDTISSWRDQRTFGGMVCWPMPQDWPWPPPPRLDHGIYAAQLEHASPAYASLVLTSPIEDDSARTPGLRMRRVATLFWASSRLQVEHRLLNLTEGTIRHAIRMVHQVPQAGCTEHRVYFPRGASRSDSADGYTCLDTKSSRILNARRQLSLDIPTGIVTFHCMDLGSKVGAYCADGWVAYVDKVDGDAFVLRGDVAAPPSEYPDQESNVLIWSGGTTSDYFEVEMQSHLSTLAAGDSLCWTTDLYRTRMYGPVLDVTRAGAVSQRLTVDRGIMTGRYGVFHVGRVDMLLSPGDIVMASWDVDPTRAFNIEQNVPRMEGARHAALVLHDHTGGLIDTLDLLNVEDVPLSSVPRIARRGSLAAWYGDGTLWLNAPHSIHHIAVYAVDGCVVKRFSGSGAGLHSYRMGKLRPGAYVYRITAGRTSVQRSMVVR